MILKTFLNSRPSFSEGIAYKQQASSVNIGLGEEGPKFCACLYECKFKELAFYDLDSDSEYSNDSHSILINLASDTSTFNIELTDPNGQKHQLNNDDFGTFYGKGFNDIQPFKCGYVINWKKVFQQTSADGTYFYTVTVNNFGKEETIKSREFSVFSFDDVSANDTFKIQAENTGAILNGEDYRGMIWPTSKRIGGKVLQLEINSEKISYLSSNDEQQQIQDNQQKSYTIETAFLESDVLLDLIENDLLANTVYLTSYGLFDFEKIIKRSVFYESVEYPVDLERSKKGKFNIVVKDKKVKIKRNI